MSILPKAIHRFNEIPIKIPMVFFTKREQTILKFICNHQRPPVINAIMRNKNAGNTMLPGFKLYYKAIPSKTVWSWHKYRHIDQWSRSTVHYNTEAKNIYWENDSLFCPVLRKLDSHTCKTINGPLYYTIHKINSKWIKDLNIIL